MNNFQTIANFEIAVRKIIEKSGLMGLTFYTGIVVEDTSPSAHRVLVQPNFGDETDPIWIDAVEGEYLTGALVLYIAVNRNQHDLLIIATIKKGYDLEKIDYSKLKDYPFVLHRKPVENITYETCDGKFFDGKKSCCPAADSVWKIVYGEEYLDANMVWEEELIRDVRSNQVTSIITRLPPDNSVTFQIYFHRDENGSIIKSSFQPQIS